MIEEIKLIGGIAGLATAAFTIWDRLVRGRPLAYIVVNGEYGTPFHYLRVRNIGDVGIIVTGVRARPAGSVAKDHSIRAIVSGVVGDAPAAIIDPGADHDFVLLRGEAEEDGPSMPIWLFVFWRRTSATWLPLPPRIVRTSTGDLRLMGKAWSVHDKDK
jgi:hypothetical protein